MISQKLKILNRIRPSVDSWWHTGSDRPSTRLHATDHHSMGLTVHPVFHSPHCLPIHFVFHHILYEELMGDSVRSAIETKVNNIHCSLVTHQAIHFIAEDYQVDQAWLPLCEAMLTTPTCLLVLHVHGKYLQD